MQTRRFTFLSFTLASLAFACKPAENPPPAECGLVAKDLADEVAKILTDPPASWEAELVDLAKRDGWNAVLCAVELFTVSKAAPDGSVPIDDRSDRAKYFILKYGNRKS